MTVYSAEERLKTLFVSGLAGNASEYRVFLSELTRHLRGYLRKRIPQLHDDVEDLVQEILLAVHNARHTYRPDEPLTAWVHAIARYKLMDFFRTRARRESLHDPLDEHDDIFAESADEPADAHRETARSPAGQAAALDRARQAAGTFSCRSFPLDGAIGVGRQGQHP